MDTKKLEQDLAYKLALAAYKLGKSNWQKPVFIIGTNNPQIRDFICQQFKQANVQYSLERSLHICTVFSIKENGVLLTPVSYDEEHKDYTRGWFNNSGRSTTPYRLISAEWVFKLRSKGMVYSCNLVRSVQTLLEQGEPQIKLNICPQKAADLLNEDDRICIESAPYLMESFYQFHQA